MNQVIGYVAPHQVYDVRDYGAVGDGVTDDAPAFQAAIDAAVVASGTLRIPSMKPGYRLNSGLTVQPVAAGQYVFMNVDCDGANGMLNYQGPSDSAVFTIKNWKYSRVEGLKISLLNQDDVTIFDIVQSSSPNYFSTGALKFSNILLGMGTGRACRGFRTGTDGVNGDISFVDFENILVTNTGGDNTRGMIGWQQLNANMLVCNWWTSGGSYLTSLYAGSSWLTHLPSGIDAAVTTISIDDATPMATQGRARIELEEIAYTGRSNNQLTGCTRGINGTTAVAHAGGAVVYEGIKRSDGTFRYDAFGGGSMGFYGCGGSFNRSEFLFRASGGYLISGGRWEQAGRFLQHGFFASSGPATTIQDVILHESALPADGVVFAIGTPGSLVVRSLYFYGVDVGATFIKATGFDGWGAAPNIGSVKLEACKIQTTVPTVWSVPATWSVMTDQSRTNNTVGQPTGWLAGAQRHLSATAVHDFGSIPAQSCNDGKTITVTGAAVGDTVELGPPAALEAGLTATGIVTSANTVTVRLCNVTAAPIDPASATWRATVRKAVA